MHLCNCLFLYPFSPLRHVIIKISCFISCNKIGRPPSRLLVFKYECKAWLKLHYVFATSTKFTLHFLVRICTKSSVWLISIKMGKTLIALYLKSTFKLVRSQVSAVVQGGHRTPISPPNKQKTKELRISVKLSMTCKKIRRNFPTCRPWFFT